MMQRVVSVLFLILCALGPLSYVAAAPTPSLPREELRIESVIHDAKKPLKMGDRLRVTTRGSSGGVTTFHIFGVASDVGMRRIQSGGYGQPALFVGNYSVQSGDSVRNAAVLATLSMGGREITTASEQTVTIDAHPPRTTSRHPEPQAGLANLRPNIVATFLDEITSVDRASVRLIVNGRDVTSRAAISGSWVSYIPEAPLPQGRNRVLLTASDRAGNALRDQWVFEILRPNALIASVTLNQATPLRPREALAVVVVGAPGGRASFTIGGGSVNPMRESGSGRYVGSYVAGSGVSVLDAPVTVTLTRGGSSATLRAATGVTILARPPAPPVIDTPRPGTPTDGRLLLRGRSSPGFVIEGRISFTTRSVSEPRPGLLGEFTTVAGRTGTWSMMIDPMIAPGDSRLTITVTAVDPAGQRSVPAVLELTAD